MPNDRAKINAFMDRLHIANYAPTLDGIHTTRFSPIFTYACAGERSEKDERQRWTNACIHRIQRYRRSDQRFYTGFETL